jgi:molecular chaperone GrpE
MQVESDQPENTVVEELQKGYKVKERVLRPSMVKVAK